VVVNAYCPVRHETTMRTGLTELFFLYDVCNVMVKILFHSFWLSLEHHKLVSIKATPSEGCVGCELPKTAEKLRLTTGTRDRELYLNCIELV